MRQSGEKLKCDTGQEGHLLVQSHFTITICHIQYILHIYLIKLKSRMALKKGKGKYILDGKSVAVSNHLSGVDSSVHDIHPTFERCLQTQRTAS